MISLKASSSKNAQFVVIILKEWGPLTLHSQLKRHVGHADHVRRDAGEDELVVVPAYIDESKVDGVNVWPIDVWLEGKYQIAL